MTAQSETAYPLLVDEPRPLELDQHYTPSDDEKAWAAENARTTRKRIGLLILLKCAQRLGYFPLVRDIPSTYRDHIARAGGLIRSLSDDDLARIDADSSRYANISLCRQRLGIRPLEKGGDWLLTVAKNAAQTKHQIADIVNVMLEELVHHRHELPGFTTLERTAKTARDQVDEAHFSSISDRLIPHARRVIDKLFKRGAGASTTAWNALKQEPGRPTNKAVREYLHHIRHLQKLAADMPKVTMPVPKLRYYRTLARAQNATEMADLKPNKRYALAVIYIRSCQGKALDDAADLFIRLFSNLENNAQRRLQEYRADHQKVVDGLVQHLHDAAVAYQAKGSAHAKLNAIIKALGGDAAAIIARCIEHLAFAGNNHLPFMLAGYPPVRSILFNCLEIMNPRSTTDVRALERLIGCLKDLKQSRNEVIWLADLGVDSKRDLAWMSAQWKKLVFGDRSDPTAVNRKYFELAVLQQVRNELKGGDLYIQSGEKYDDYREQLVDRTTFAEEVEEYGEVTGLDIEPKAFVEQLRAKLTQRALDVDKAFPLNSHARIINGRLSLGRLPKTVEPPEAEQLELAIRDRLKKVSILDVLIDAERWLDLHTLFKPIAGTESRIEDLRKRFVTTLFCYGCNLGASQTSQSVKGISRRQLSWLNLKYVTEENLDQAIVKVTNAYAKFELPGYWGSGKSASADGTKWDLYERNLFSEYHIRYGGYGGIGYYHVSDKYIALFGNFIPCGVYEGVFIVDGLYGNESDIQPDTIHGDTHAQNFAVFSICHLLGIKLMPRIRGIKGLTFYRPTPGTKYKHIDALFGEAINWKLIETHFNEMLRVVVSIRMGKITASTILRRFGTTSRRNKLSQAFRELGKVIRTLFLLDYIDGAELRKLIHAATNKSEVFNNFIQWVFFGGEGVIQENVAHEQQKVIKYSHLAANMICLHNVQAMSQIIKQLRDEGINVTPEMLEFLSPYRTRHINRLGDYILDFERPADPLNPEIKLLL